jgi:long-chain acyl-CoA synthetase
MMTQATSNRLSDSAANTPPPAATDIPNTLFDLIYPFANSSDNVLLCDDGTAWQGHEFYEKVARLALLMQSRYALEKGDKVALLFWNQPEFFVTFFALRALGLIAVPINILMPPEDVAYVLQHSGVKTLIGCEELVQQILTGMGLTDATVLRQSDFSVLVSNAQTNTLFPTMEEAMTILPDTPSWKAVLDLIREPINPDELALLIYTSGTTGVPKGVMLSERNLLSNLSAFSTALNIDNAIQEPTFLLGLPLFHSYGLICGLYAFLVQAKMVFVPKFNPKRMVSALQQYKVSFLPLVPTMFTLLLTAAKRSIDAGQDSPFPQLKWCISGGAALPEALLTQLKAVLGVTVLEGYGLTETSPVIAVNLPSVGAVPNSVGPVLPNVTVRLIQHETQKLVPVTPGIASDEGEIQVKGPNVMLGYYQNNTETAAVFTDDGWFKTGDLGKFDAKGNLYISGGRLKDLIIRAGENIAPLPIERILSQHPAVAAVAVIPKKDSKLGEAIHACVELAEDVKQQPDFTELQLFQALANLVRTQLTPSFVPDSFTLHEALPKNPTGKVMKKKLIELGV